MANPLDPSSWPLWVQLVCGWGPLGVGWYISELRRARSERAHHASRDRCAEEIAAVHERRDAELIAERERRDAEASAMRDAHIKTVEDMSALHREDIQVLRDKNDRQINAVTTRLIRLLEVQSTAARAVVSKAEQKKLQLEEGANDVPDDGRAG